MFCIAQSESYDWPVKVMLAGATKPQEFTVKFRRLGQDELNELYQRLDAALAAGYKQSRAEALSDSEQAELEFNDKQFCREVVVGWDKVKDENGNAAEFDAENFERLLDHVPVPATIVTTFRASLAGAKQKNL